MDNSESHLHRQHHHHNNNNASTNDNSSSKTGSSANIRDGKCISLDTCPPNAHILFLEPFCGGAPIGSCLPLYLMVSAADRAMANAFDQGSTDVHASEILILEQ